MGLMAVRRTEEACWLLLGMSLLGLAQHSICCRVLCASLHPLLTPDLSVPAAKMMKQEEACAFQHLAFPRAHVH